MPSRTCALLNSCTISHDVSTVYIDTPTRDDAAVGLTKKTTRYEQNISRLKCSTRIRPDDRYTTTINPRRDRGKAKAKAKSSRTTMASDKEKTDCATGPSQINDSTIPVLVPPTQGRAANAGPRRRSLSDRPCGSCRFLANVFGSLVLCAR